MSKLSHTGGLVAVNQTVANHHCKSGRANDLIIRKRMRIHQSTQFNYYFTSIFKAGVLPFTMFFGQFLALSGTYYFPIKITRSV